MIKFASLCFSGVQGKFFVGSLSWGTDQDSLYNYFSQFGEVSDAVVIMDRETGRSKGFGFVTFSDPKCVDSVLRSSHTIDGRQVSAKPCISR